jgi:mutator protein MutT
MAVPPHARVAAAVIERDGTILVTRRPPHGHLGSLWEFPGGKCEPDETLVACLARELEEELGSIAVVHECLWSVTHAYADKVVELHFFRCDLLEEPQPLLDQEMRWVARADLESLEFPEADRAFIARLREVG